MRGSVLEGYTWIGTIPRAQPPNLRKPFEGNPSLRTLTFLLGQARIKQHRLADAIAAFQGAAPLNSQSPESHLGLDLPRSEHRGTLPPVEDRAPTHPLRRVTSRNRWHTYCVSSVERCLPRYLSHGCRPQYHLVRQTHAATFSRDAVASGACPSGKRPGCASCSRSNSSREVRHGSASNHSRSNSVTLADGSGRRRPTRSFCRRTHLSLLPDGAQPRQELLDCRRARSGCFGRGRTVGDFDEPVAFGEQAPRRSVPRRKPRPLPALAPAVRYGH
jgi:hypothetical protein